MPCIQGTTAIFFVLALLSAAAAQSQQPETIVTDRPTQTAAPYVLPPLWFQVEAGYKFSRFDEGSVRADVHELPDVLMRFGILKRIEARLTVPGWNFRAIDFFGGSVNDNFLQDINIGAKIAIVEEQGPRPAFSLLADVRVPVGSEFESDGLVTPKLLALFSHSVTERLDLMYNVGPSFVREYYEDSSDTTKRVDLEYTAMLTGSLTRGSSWFIELFGGFLSGRNSDEHTLQAGATALLANDFQLDARAGVGLVKNVPDWLAGLGLSFRLPR